MTKKQQQDLLNQAIGASFALSQTAGSGVARVASVPSFFSSAPSSSSPSPDGTFFVPPGAEGDLSLAADGTDTGFFFPNGSSMAFVIAGRTVATLNSSGLRLVGGLQLGDTGDGGGVGDTTGGNLLGVAVTASDTTWVNNEAIEFCSFPVVTASNTCFFIFLSEENGTVSASDKVYFVAARGTTAETTYLCTSAFTQEKGPTYWDLMARTTPERITFYIRRRNSTGTSTTNAVVKVTVVSDAVGKVAVVNPPTPVTMPTPTEGFPSLGLTFSQAVSSLSLNSESGNSYIQLKTSSTGTVQNKTVLVFPTASPARSNNVASENTSDVYVLQVKWNSGGQSSDTQEKLYDVQWVNRKYTPMYVPNDASTAAHQHKMGTATTPVEQVFVWPATGPVTGSYVLQTSYNTTTKTHTLSWTSASSLVPSTPAFTSVSASKFTQTSNAPADESMFKRLAADTSFYTSSLYLGWTGATFPTSTSATGSSATTPPVLPANPVGFIEVTINGTAAKIPYYS